jgi:histone deacetylase 1/2
MAVRQILSLFVYTRTSSIIYILIYIDDIIIIGSNDVTITDIIHRLQQEFVITDLGSLTFFLGVEAIRDDIGIYLTQRRYIVDLLIK